MLKEDWCQEYSSRDGPLLQTASEDGLSKVIDFRGRVMKTVDLGTPLYTLTHTPELFDSSFGFGAATAFGGTQIIVKGKQGMTQARFSENQNKGPVWKLRYTSVGTELFSACDDGKVRRQVVDHLCSFAEINGETNKQRQQRHRYRRTATHHSFADVVLSHMDDIEDMDISFNDECERLSHRS